MNAVEISLDTQRLENLKHLDGGAIRAACPACRKAGSDKSGEHLLIQPGGKFGCAANPKDHEHRKEIFRLAGIKTAPLPAIPAPPAKPQFKKEFVCAYDYPDASGKLSFQVERFKTNNPDKPKTFLQRRPDGNGGWNYNMDGVEKVLFRLPEILRAIAGGKFIFLTEGEQDALAMVQRGFDATCNPGGAAKKADGEKWLNGYTETLRGADVAIIADKDSAGRTHAQIVAGKLHGVAKSVRVLELPDTNGKTVKDAHDFFAAGGTAETIFELVDTAPIWTPAAPDSNQADVAAEYLGDEAEQPQPSLIERLEARIYSAQVKPREPMPRFYLAGVQVSTAGNLTTISAQAKAGKSAAIAAMIASTYATPEADCLGFISKNPNGFAVVHLDTEQAPFDHWEGNQRTNRRAKVDAAPAWLRSYCLTGFSAADVRLAIRILTAQSAKQSGGVHSVFVDGIADAVHDVNDPAETSSLITELHKLAIEFDCPILNIVHLNPGSDFKTRGHLGSQLERKSETNLRLEKDDSGATVIWADKNRRAPIPKNTAPRFAWNDEAGMHVTVASLRNSKDEAEKQAMQDEAEAVFTAAGNAVISYGNFISFLEREVHISKSTSKRRLAQMIRTGIVRKELTGFYALNR